MKLWEDHQRKEGKYIDDPSLQEYPQLIGPIGKPVSHQFAKEAIAGLVGSQVDRLAETKGMDEIDRLRAREHAQKHAEQMYDEHYVDGHGASEYDPSRYGPHESFSRRGW